MFKYSVLLALLSIAYCNAYVTDSFESNFSNKYIRASKRILSARAGRTKKTVYAPVNV